MEVEAFYVTPDQRSGVRKFSGPLRPGEPRRIFTGVKMIGRKRKRVSSGVFVGRKARRLITTRRLAPPATRGFYGLNQGKHGKELKDAETAATTYECSTTGASNLINGVAQGTDFTNRVGRRFTIKSILVRGHVRVGATPTASAVRIMLVWDRQANGAAPAITDVLSATSMEGLQNLSNRDRFIVYMDKTTYLEAAGRSSIPIKKYLRCTLETTNSGTANTVGSIATGALYLMTMGELVTGATAPVATLATRVRFFDD